MSVAADIVNRASDPQAPHRAAQRAVGQQRTPAARAAVERQMAAQIRYRVATGKVGHPFILLEGEEGSGKSYAIVALAHSPRVGDAYFIEVGEKKLDEYGDDKVRLIEHDGSYHEIVEQVEAVSLAAQAAIDAGAPPVVLCIDSATPLWEGLCDWVNQRARSTDKAKEILRRDPSADITVGRALWNDANARWARLIKFLRTFPGIVVVTARGKVISATDPNTGQPFRDGRKDYAVQSNKALPFDVDVWVRMTRDDDPQVIKSNNRNMPIKYEKNKRTFREENSEDLRIPRGADLLDHLIFDRMKYDPANASDPDQYRQFTAGGLTEDEVVTDRLEARAEEASQRAAVERSSQVDPSVAYRAAVAAARADSAKSLDDIEKRAADLALLMIPVAKALAPEWAGRCPGVTPEVRLGQWIAACRTHLDTAADSVANAAAADADRAASQTPATDGAPTLPIGDPQ